MLQPVGGDAIGSALSAFLPTAQQHHDPTTTTITTTTTTTTNMSRYQSRTLDKKRVHSRNDGCSSNNNDIDNDSSSDSLPPRFLTSPASIMVAVPSRGSKSYARTLVMNSHGHTVRVIFEYVSGPGRCPRPLLPSFTTINSLSSLPSTRNESSFSRQVSFWINPF